MLTYLTNSASSVRVPPGATAETVASSPTAPIRLYAWTFVVFCVAAIAGVWRRAGDFYAATLDTDESVYIVIARRWLEGDLPYVAVYDLHPIGLPALIAGATWLLGDGLLAARITAVFAVAGTCAGLYFAGARFVVSRSVGFVAAILYGVYMLRPEAMVSNTELYNNLFITLAACLLFGQVHRISTARKIWPSHALMAAFLLGAGLQIKYVVFPEAAGFCLAFLAYWAWHKQRVRSVLGLAAGMVLAGLTPTLTAVLYFWSQGAIQEFLDANIGSNMAYVAAVPPLEEVLYRIYVGLKPLAVLIGGTALLAAALRGQLRSMTAGTQPLMYACMLWAALSTVNIVLPMKFFGHYFLALLPPFCLMAAVLITSALKHTRLVLKQPLSPGYRVLGLALAVTIFAAPPLRAIALHIAAPATSLLQATELATACIREHSASQPGLYVFNWDPILYETASVAPPTRYVLPAELAEFGHSARVDPSAEISRILATRPGHIVVASESHLPFRPEHIAMVQRAIRSYNLVCSVPMRVSKDEAGYALVYRLP